MTMTIASRLAVAILAWSGFLLSSLLSSACGEDTEVGVRRTADGYVVRYMSGNAVYAERLQGGRWLGCGWSADARTDVENIWADRRVRTADETAAHFFPDAGIVIVNGLEMGGLRPSAGSACRDPFSPPCVSPMSHFPLTSGIHTLLDGTPVLTRWLDITNTSKQPLALTTCIPWCGRLWSGESPDHLRALPAAGTVNGKDGLAGLRSRPGKNVFRNERGLVWDDPYFVLRNESNGEYFFGQLAWPVNYVMEFQRERGLSFKIGPLAANALHVISPGETIRTPAVHLAHTKGDFDLTVQAMHDHIRRSVLPPRRPDRGSTGPIHLPGGPGAHRLPWR